MIDLSKYKTRRELEALEPEISRGGWDNLERKAKVKPALKQRLKNRVRFLYRVQDVPKLIAASKSDFRRVYPKPTVEA